MKVVNINLEDLIQILNIFKEDRAILVDIETIFSTNTIKITYSKSFDDTDITAKEII